MKQKHRHKTLDDLLARLRSGDFDTREYALFQTALLLELRNRSSDSARWPAYFAENLTRELMRLRLSDAEQARVAAAVSRLAETYPAHRATAIWTLSKAGAIAGLSSMAELLHYCGAQLESADALLACVGICAWLESPAEAGLQDTNRSTIDSLRSTASDWSRRGDARLSSACGRLIALLKTSSELPPDAEK